MSWTSNTPISRPIKIANVQPTVDLGGLMFSHTLGLMFNPQSDYEELTTPPPTPSTTS